MSREGVRVARDRQLVAPLLRCLWSQGVASTGMGDYEAALAAFREGLALAEKMGNEGELTRFSNTLGWLHIDCGDLPMTSSSKRMASEQPDDVMEWRQLADGEADMTTERKSGVGYRYSAVSETGPFTSNRLASPPFTAKRFRSKPTSQTPSLPLPRDSRPPSEQSPGPAR